MMGIVEDNSRISCYHMNWKQLPHPSPCSQVLFYCPVASAQIAPYIDTFVHCANPKYCALKRMIAVILKCLPHF